MVKVIFNNVTSPYGLLLIAVIVLAVGRVVFKKKYLNCYEIINRHLECFKASDNRYSKVSLFLYFGVPVLVSIALVRIRNIDDDVVNIITVIISILTSMLFTMLTLVLDMRKRIISDKEYNANKAAISAKLLKETYYSIMYEILNSIIILIICFVELFSKSYSRISSLMIYYLVFTLLMNLFMVLKRIFKVIDNDINNDV
jgi:hypothetical protein|nr:MAG TPA: hypothetical protein [Caudoviricetes sp.]